LRFFEAGDDGDDEAITEVGLAGFVSVIFAGIEEDWGGLLACLRGFSGSFPTGFAGTGFGKSPIVGVGGLEGRPRRRGEERQEGRLAADPCADVTSLDDAYPQFRL
jgi:hypothetical protein